MYISNHTFRGHAHEIFKKGGVNNRAEFSNKFPDIIEFIQQVNVYPEIEEKVNEAIELSWDGKKKYDDCFDEFSLVVERILQLDYQLSLPTFKQGGYRKNIYNFFGSTITSISEKVEESTISKKSIDAFFETQRDIVFIVTDEQFKIRTINKVGEKLFGKSLLDLIRKHLT